MGRIADLFKSVGSQLGSSGPVFDLLREVARELDGLAFSAQSPQLADESKSGSAIDSGDGTNVIYFDLVPNEQVRIFGTFEIMRTNSGQAGDDPATGEFYFNAYRNGLGTTATALQTRDGAGNPGVGAVFEENVLGNRVYISFTGLAGGARGSVWATKRSTVQEVVTAG